MFYQQFQRCQPGRGFGIKEATYPSYLCATGGRLARWLCAPRGALLDAMLRTIGKAGLLFFLFTASCFRQGPPGQAEWEAFLAKQENSTQYQQFVAYLELQELADVLDPSELLRQGTDWKKLGAAPFVVPPRELWPHILPILRIVKTELKPKLGDLEVMSGYRTATYNQQADGASRSRHQLFEALDLQPKSSLSRKDLHRELRSLWQSKGKPLQLGLGLYSGTRFHIDAWRYRTW
jgi:hypothetical protein